jgi:hypothetical protein
MTASSFTFHVSSRSGSTPNPLQLTGTADNGMSLKTLRVSTSDTNETISKTATLGHIGVSQSDYNSIANHACPFNLIISDDDQGDKVVVQALDVEGLVPGLAALETDVHELRATAAAIDERLAEDVSGSIVHELRILNRRVASIELLLIEAREFRTGALPPTGTGHR